MVKPLVIQPVKLNVGSYTSNISRWSRTIERDTLLAAFAVSVKEVGALTDHFVTSLKHNNYEAVGGDVGTTAGVPLGAIACKPRQLAVTTQPGRRAQLAPWPGRYNDLDWINHEYARVARKFGSGSREAIVLAARKELARHVGARSPWPMTLWPLDGGSDFVIDVRRLSGGTTPTEVILWCVKLPAVVYRNLCKLQELPFWANKKLDYSSDAQEIGEVALRIEARENHGLMLRHIFVQGYDDDGTPAFDEITADAFQGRIKYEGQEFYDGVAQARLALTTQFPAFISDVDEGRALNAMINPKANLVFDLYKALTSNAADLYLTAYGTLTPVGEFKQAEDAAIVTL